MTNYADYATWLADGRWIRISARALIFNAAGDRILIERNVGAQNEHVNFIGGGVEVGETLQECIARELAEETDAKIVHARYLLLLENFWSHDGEVRHSLEHYFEIGLDREEITPRYDNVEFIWTPIAALEGIDLRPAIVRNRIVDGTFREVGHLVAGNKDA